MTTFPSDVRGSSLRYTPAEIEGWAKVIAAVAGALAALGAGLIKGLGWWRRRSERRRLEAKAIRYLLDAQRQVLNIWAAREPLVDLSELERQKWLVDEVRDELWLADGHDGERSEQRQAEELQRLLTRTQAIRAKEEATAAGQPPMFKDVE